MLKIEQIDLDLLATALADQSADEYQWTIDPATGEISTAFDSAISGEPPDDLEELGLTPIEALPSRVWFRDMADFTDLLTDERAARRLARSLQGRGSFRRFRNELHDEHPELVPAWNAFRDTRAARRAVERLLDNKLIDEDAADRYRRDHPDPSVQ
ncbi:hypothetical protein [Actinoplanes sp. NPDC049599]|uniref:hypothetical protein n=1 Tax=Actinoplanes sp. NPDC049599 TaxID=3363903 RepID=UPI003793D4D3